MKIKHLAFAILASGLLGLVSCKETEKIEPDASGLEAVAGPDQNVLPVTPVTIDGSASKGPETKAFAWTLLSKPTNSTLALGASGNARATFTPDIVGYYEFELTVRADGKTSKDKIKIKAEYPDPVVLNAPITTDTRLFDRFIDPSKPDYIVSADITVKAALSVDRDVVVAFQRDKSLLIDEKGNIVADGADQQRVRFTGVEATKGFWAGIRLYSPSTANRFAFTDIEYAGSRVAFTGTKAGLAMFGNNKTHATLTDCRFISNDGYGLYVQSGCVIAGFARNSFSRQTEAGILADAYNTIKLDAASKFTGENGRDAVEISSSEIVGAAEVVWSAFDDHTPYRLLGNLDVNTGWQLKPGVKVQVARDASIRVNRNGYLSAKGTKDNKVQIGGIIAAGSSWRGIIFYSVSNLNMMDYTEITGAGSAVMVSGQRSAVTAYGKGARLTITNSHIINSGGYGIMFTSDAELNTDAGSANTFTGNTQGNLFKL